MIRAFAVADGRLRPIDVDEVETAPGDWIWVDAVEADPDDVARLCRRLGFNELAIDDVTREVHFPKIDDFDDHLLVVLHGIAELDERLDTIEIDAFITERLLMTVHNRVSSATEWMIQQCMTVGSPALGSPDRALAQLADIATWRMLPLIEALDDEIEDLEDRAMAGDQDLVGDVQALRRDVLRLKRVVGPQAALIRRLGSFPSQLIGTQAQREFRSTQDHLVRLTESLDAARGLLAAVLDTHRSTVSERMNEVMKVLTVYAAILLPLSLLAGIYGMNFVNMPELDEPYGYFVLLGVMAVIAIAQWTYFASRGFVGSFRPRRVTRVVGKGLVRLARLPVDVALGAATTTAKLLQEPGARKGSAPAGETLEVDPDRRRVE